MIASITQQYQTEFLNSFGFCGRQSNRSQKQLFIINLWCMLLLINALLW